MKARVAEAERCGTCSRWTAYKVPGSRYGRCQAPRAGTEAQPYWRGNLTSHDQVDTAASHGADCAAHKRGT